MATWNASKNRWQTSVGTGKNRKFFRARTAAEADELKRLFLEGPLPPPPGSLLEFVEQVWWPMQLAKRDAGKLTASTVDAYAKNVIGEIVPRFGQRPINAIRFEELQAWVTSMATQPITRRNRTYTREPKTISNIWSLMRSILQTAVHLRRTSLTDFLLVETPEFSRRKEREDLDLSLLATFEELAKGSDLVGPIFAAGRLGLRLNEVCGLKRTDIEIRELDALLTVRWNRQKYGETDRLKAKRRGQGRKLLIPLEWARYLLSLAPPTSIYLFLDRKGVPIAPARVTKQFAKLADRAGRPEVTFHQLRALLTSSLRVLGTEKRLRADILGHSREETTDIYEDTRASSQLEAFTKLAAAIEETSRQALADDARSGNP